MKVDLHPRKLLRNRLLALIHTLLAVTCLGLSSPGELCAQSRSLRTAQEYFSEGAYHRAIPFFQRALKKEFNFDAMRGLAESFRHTRDFPEAGRWYGYVVNTQYASAEDHLQYGLVLMRLEQYELARDQFQRFQELMPRDERGARYVEAARLNQRLPRGRVNYEVTALPFNSGEADFSPLPYGEGVLFTSARIKDKVVQRNSDRDGRPFMDLYLVKSGSNAEWGRPRLLKGRFNTKFHEAAAVYDPNHRLFFFTRNNFLSGKLRSSQDGRVKLKVFFAHLNAQGEWTDLQSLPFNSDEYSVGHPSLSSDGKLLFFASDMPGGFGGTDIWYSQYADTGWSAPTNLGPLVNTVGDEFFPTMQPDGNLFFSSDGHGGAGGLDLFMARRRDTGWGDVRRLPAPLNSAGDDIGYTLNPDGETGYFSSDRAGGQGLDDVYAFRVLNPVFSGTVTSRPDGAPLADAVVTVTDAASGEPQRFQTNPDGRFGMILERDRKYEVEVSHEAHLSQRMALGTEGAEAIGRQTRIFILERPRLVIDGTARDQRTGYALAGVKVSLEGQESDHWSAAGGMFRFNLEPGGKLKLTATRTGYLPVEMTVDAEVGAGIHRIPVALEMERDLGKVMLQGQVLDATGQPIAGADLFLIHRAAREELTGKTDTNGTFLFPLVPGDAYQLVARHPGYRTGQEAFSAPKSRSGVFPRNITLALTGSGRASVLKNVYYEYGESLLREASLTELDKLVRLLKLNPDKRIVVSSSTDARGSDRYNLALSQRRADAVARYLKAEGIAEERIEAIGYGETRLVNECRNGATCSEAQHRANRRTEFTLLPARRTEYRAKKRPVSARPARAETTIPVAAADGNYPALDPEQPVCYRVQVGVFREKDKPDLRARLGDLAEDLVVEPIDTTGYRYQIGECYIYARAKEVLQVARTRKDMQDAFIAAYQNGRRVGIPRGMERPEND